MLYPNQEACHHCKLTLFIYIISFFRNQELSFDRKNCMQSRWLRGVLSPI
ncbi:hypothetical protein Patl1_21223 [Pistacia atlantica]|uniref:Uncharacterized protein n=1 Tax=Pistacia atlantica TaxID=434234 RepID=A0ACC1BHV0_9ROSI|nr:hypothetical protein Patl1_21223 [Pistacia atlantica]